MLRLLKPFLRHLSHVGLAMTPFHKHPVAGRRRRHAGRRGFTIAHEALEPRALLSGVPMTVSLGSTLASSWDVSSAEASAFDPSMAVPGQTAEAAGTVYGVLAATGLSATASASLAAGVAQAEQVLGRIFASSDTDAVLQDVFGRAGTDAAAFSSAVAAVRSDWSAGRIGVQVQAIGGAAMGRGLGAYAAGHDGAARIFVNADWLSGATADDVARVLLEEFGHSLDVRLNGAVDSPGDEGELFSATATGAALSPAERAGILAEDDRGQIVVDAQAVAVEFSATAIASSTLGATLTTTQSINRTSATSIAVTVTYNATNNNGADILVAAYNGSSLIGWTVYNRVTNLDAGGGGSTATIDLTFNLAQFNTNVTTGGLNLRAWQGTAGPAASVGTANNTTPAQTNGTSGTAVPFSINTATAPGSAGNIPAVGAATTTWTNTTVDVTLPTVSSVAITSATGKQGSLLNASDEVSVTVTMSESVTVTGTPTLTLNVGGTNRTANYASGSGSTALVFKYTIQAGETDADGISIGANALALSGGTIADAAGNAATITHAAVAANNAYLVETTAPTVSSVAITSATGKQGSLLNAGDEVSVTVTMSESVTVTGTPTLTLNVGGTNRTANYASGSGSTALVFKYTIQAGETDADGISIGANALALSGGTIVDAAGNAATLTHSAVAANNAYLVETTAPTVSSVVATGTGITSGSGVVTAGAVVTLTVNLSEAVTVTGTPTLSLSSGGTATYSSGSGTSALVFTSTVGTTDSTGDLTVTALNTPEGATLVDAAGNALATFTADPGTVVVNARSSLNLNGLSAIGDPHREVSFVSSNPTVPVAFTATGVSHLSDLDSTAFASIDASVAVSEVDDGDAESILVDGAAATTRILLGSTGSYGFTLGGVSYTATVATVVRSVSGVDTSFRVVTFQRATGTMSTAEVESVLDALRYDNTAFPPTTTDRRTFEVTVTDDRGAVSEASNLVVTVQAGTPPVIDLNGADTGNNRSVTFTEGDSGVALAASGVTSLSPEGALFTRIGIGFNPASFVDTGHEAMVIEGIDVGDTAITVLPFDAAIGTTGSFTLGGTSYAYQYVFVSASLHRIYVTGAGGTTLTHAEAERVLDAYRYRNTSENPTTTAPRTINVGTAVAGVSNTPAQFTVTLASVNDAPVVTAGGSLTYVENGAAAAIDSGIELSDVDGTTLTGATVTISAGLTTGDVLGFVDQNGISGSFDAGTGVLALSGTAGLAHYRTALRSVTYRSTSDVPAVTSASRTISWQVNDGAAANNLSTPVTSTVTITSVKDAPAGTDATVTLLEDGSHVFAASDFGFTDPSDAPADSLAAVRIVSLPAAGELRYDGVAITAQQVAAGYSVSAADIASGKLSFVPAADGYGAGYASFQFKVQDDGGTADGGIDLDPTANTITLDVTAVLDPILVSLVTDSGASGSDKYTNVGTLATTSPDPGSTVQYSIDGGQSWTGTFTAVEGSNTVWVRQTDGSQVSEVVAGSKLTFTLDTTVAPLGAALLSDTGSSSTDKITKVGDVSVTAVEGESTVSFSTDGGVTWSTGSIAGNGTLSGFTPSSGLNALRLRQTDKAGNVSPVTPFMYTYESGAAAPTVALVNDTGRSNSDRITRAGAVAVGNVKPGALVRYSTDAGVNWSASVSPANGVCCILVKQIDIAGNVSDVAESLVTVDTTAPLAPAVSLLNDTGRLATDKITSDARLDIRNFEAVGSDPLVEYSTNGVTWTTTFTPVQGVNAVRVRLTDVAGNISPVTSFSFTFDSTQASASTVTLPTAATYTVGQKISIAVRFSEAVFFTGTAANLKIELDFGGGQKRYATYTSGTGTNTIVFSYTFQTADKSTAAATTGVLFNSATIASSGDAALKDTAGNNARLTFTLPSSRPLVKVL